jgi:cytochrome subunit of sulfide dehydrogenase
MIAPRFLLLLVLAATTALAQEPAPSFAAPNLSPAGVRSLAMNCAICHGPDGRAQPGSAVSALAGRDAREIVEAMAAFKQGARPATVMHQIAKGYSDAEIEAMARWFAGQREARR